MTYNNFFKFEDENIDFPLYNDENIENNNITLITISLILFIFLSLGPINFPDYQHQIIFFIITLIPLLIFTKGYIGTFFRKPSINDLRLVIVSYIGYELYYLIIAGLLSFIHFQVTKGDTSGNLTLLLFITNILQIIGEEIFKVFLFLLCMRMFYKHKINRKTGIIMSSLIILVMFGLLHVNTYKFNIIQILLFQGLGSIFELFTYLKTKNLTLSVLIHILINVSYWVMLLS